MSPSEILPGYKIKEQLGITTLRECVKCHEVMVLGDMVEVVQDPNPYLQYKPDSHLTTINLRVNPELPPVCSVSPDGKHQEILSY